MPREFGENNQRQLLTSLLPGAVIPVAPESLVQNSSASPSLGSKLSGFEQVKTISQLHGIENLSYYLLFKQIYNKCSYVSLTYNPTLLPILKFLGAVLEYKRVTSGFPIFLAQGSDLLNLSQPIYRLFQLLIFFVDIFFYHLLRVYV